MAKDKNTRKPYKPPTAPAPDVLEPLPPDEEEDLLFKAQMGLANVVLGYWRHGLGLLAVLLLVALGYGSWDKARVETQKEISAGIAKVDRSLPEPSPLYFMGQGPQDDLSDPERVQALEKAAGEYEAVAGAGKGTGAAVAWLKAAEIWERLERPENAAKAFAAADAVGAEGIVGWSAGMGHAHALALAGDVDGAAAILRGLAGGEPSLSSERALYQLGLLYEDAGRASEAGQVYTEFKERFPESTLMEKVALASARIGSAG